MSIERYNAMLTARKLLEALSLADGPHQTMAKTILKNYPDDVLTGCMVGEHEERRCGLWSRSPNNPIEYHPDKGGWIYWDETWADWHGPFETYVDCAKALKNYVERLDTPIGGN